MPSKVKAVVQIQRPRDEVYAFFTDHEACARVLHRAFSVEFTSDQRSGVGTEWMQKSEDTEKPVEALHRIVALHPPSGFTMTTDDRDSFETMVFEFTAIDDETLVSFELSIEPKGFFRGIAVRLGLAMIRDMMSEDLNRVKTGLEAGSASSHP